MCQAGRIIGSGSHDPLPTELAKKARVGSDQLVISGHKNELALKYYQVIVEWIDDKITDDVKGGSFDLPLI